jgi:copper chaperone CopZ
MQAIHIDTLNIEDETDVSLVEAILRMMAGVADVVAVRSLGIVSVLYDEHKTSPRSIVRAMRSSGYDARLLRPSDLSRRRKPRKSGEPLGGVADA